MLEWVRSLFRAKPEAGLADVWMREAYGRHGKGEAGEAEVLYRRILEADPDNADALYLLGEICRGSGRNEEAIEWIGKAIGVNGGVAVFHFSLGCALQAAERYGEAEASYRHALELGGDDAEAWTNLGVVEEKLGRMEAAEADYRRALELNPELAPAHYNLGNMLKARGRLAEAIEAYRRALELRPDYGPGYEGLGDALAAAGELEAAIAAYGKWVERLPAVAVGHLKRGVVLQRAGRLGEAGESYQRALARDPTLHEAHHCLGSVLQACRRYDEAAESYRRALEWKGDSPEISMDLGNALQELGRLEEAMTCYRQALKLRPAFAEAYMNMGCAIHRGRRFEEALACFRRALELKPDYVEAHLNLGFAHEAMGDLESALGCYERSIQLKPDLAEARWNRGLLLLLTGDFEQGWKDYEARWKMEPLMHEAIRYAKPRWDGSEAPGRTILLHVEQGVGDTLQFIRYAPLIAKRCGQVIAACLPSQKSVVETVAGISRVVAMEDALPEHDFHLPLLSAPYVLGTRLENVPAQAPYVAAPKKHAAKWERLIPAGGGLKVGVVWRGSPGHRGDRERSLQLNILSPLFQLSGVAFYSLQVGKAGAEAKELPPGTAWLDMTSEIEDFGNTAGLISRLDLVISVDTAVAHLAGALGKPVWVLLPYVPDWRWLLSREDSPWYPTMRLFRQKALGEWDGAIEEVAVALKTWAEHGGA